MPESAEPRPSLGHRLTDAAFRLLLALARALPYERRVPVAGWVFSRLVAPLVGWRARVRDNLAQVSPDLPKAEYARKVTALTSIVPTSSLLPSVLIAGSPF